VVKNLFIFLGLLIFTNLQAQAFEDCIIMADVPLVDIRIENNKIIDVCPLVTVMNEKNILIVHPMLEGITRFSVWKNYKEQVIFNVEVTESNTYIAPVDGFNIFTLDEPPQEEDFVLDLPPGLANSSEIGGEN